MEDKKTEFKVKIQEFESLFYFDETCPLYIAKEALFQCSKWLGKIEDDAKVKPQEIPVESYEGVASEIPSESVPAIETEVFQDIVCDNDPQTEEIPQEEKDDQSA